MKWVFNFKISPIHKSTNFQKCDKIPQINFGLLILKVELETPKSATRRRFETFTNISVDKELDDEKFTHQLLMFKFKMNTEVK